MNNVLKSYLEFLEQADKNFIYAFNSALKRGLDVDGRVLEFLLLECTNNKLKEFSNNFYELTELNKEQERIYEGFLQEANQELIEIIYKGLYAQKGFKTKFITRLIRSTKMIYEKNFKQSLKIRRPKLKKTQRVRPMRGGVIFKGNLDSLKRFLDKFKDKKPKDSDELRRFFDEFEDE